MVLGGSSSVFLEKTSVHFEPWNKAQVGLFQALAQEGGFVFHVLGGPVSYLSVLSRKPRHLPGSNGNNGDSS